MKILKIRDAYKNDKIVTRVVSEKNPMNRVEISSISHWNTEDKDKVYGINWSANGTVSVEEAEEYIQLMQAAIAEAKKQNSK